LSRRIPRDGSLRHDLLARPGRLFEEDRRRGFEDAARQIDHPPDRVAPPEQVREPDGSLSRRRK
jgi:hypothetical protein